MAVNERTLQILAILARKGFASVRELSEACGVSLMTIRRDLKQLDQAGRLRRTYGGASLPEPLVAPAAAEPREAAGGLSAANSVAATSVAILAGRVDVIITPSVDPPVDRLLIDQARRAGIPIIAESTPFDGSHAPVVAVDNFAGAAELGRWAARFALEHFAGQAAVLDLTSPLVHAQERSRGFLSGLRETLPEAQLVLSLHVEATEQTTYQLALAALGVHPEINIVFGVNDIRALGALRACEERGVPRDALLVVAFGLEGETSRQALRRESHLRAGLAMFPEIVGPTCIEAAVAAYRREPLPVQLITPHAVLTSANLSDFYTAGANAGFNWQTAQAKLALPLPCDFNGQTARIRSRLPQRLGFIIPFGEHEWYRNLAACMEAYAGRLGIEFEAVDAALLRQESIAALQGQIARTAANLVQPGEVVILDSNPINTLLAEELAAQQGITVITNSRAAYEVLRKSAGLTLVLTGGVVQQTGDALIGRTAEVALRELRADKLFLGATGISLGFGLSCSNLNEVPIKQAMLQAAREIILLVDHTRFDQEDIGQIAPIATLQRLVTDNTLPSGLWLGLSELGIRIDFATVES